MLPQRRPRGLNYSQVQGLQADFALPVPTLEDRHNPSRQLFQGKSASRYFAASQPLADCCTDFGPQRAQVVRQLWEIDRQGVINTCLEHVGVDL
jgi:hypothetical protein